MHFFQKRTWFIVTTWAICGALLGVANCPAMNPGTLFASTTELPNDTGPLHAGDDTDLQVLRFSVPKSDLPPDAKVVVVTDEAGNRYLAQVGGPWLLDDSTTESGASEIAWLTFVAKRTVDLDERQQRLLRPAGAGEASAALKWTVESAAGHELQLAGQPVLRLMGQAFDDSSQERRDETYKVFHHVWSPGLSEPITKGSGGLFPHHRGLFLGWNRIGLTQGGQKAEVDTWHAKKAHQRLKREVVREAGLVYGRQVLEIEWVNEAVNPPRPFIREHRELVVFPLGKHRLVQFSSRLESLSGDILLAGDPQHAGFQFRASQHVAEISKGQTYYLRPDGIDQPGKFRNWPDQQEHVNLPFQGMSFVIDDQRMTCVRLEHPQNPQPARFSERDYGRFGSYFEHRLTEQEPLEIRYQLRIVPGEVELESIRRWHQDFVDPLTPQWQSPTRLGPEEFPAELDAMLHLLQPLAQQPVFQGEPGQWDAVLRERGWIMFDEGQFKMWYTGYDGQRTAIKNLGMAFSSDGLVWERSAANPLAENHWIEDMMVAKHDGVYWMFAEGREDVAHWFRSDDGENWERMGPLDIRTTGGQPIEAGPRGTPTVFRGQDHWYLLYERKDAGIWLAKSSDLHTWTHVQDEPVIGLADREYDQQMIALNQVVPVDGGYLAFFHSSSDSVAPRRWVCSAAFSKDLRNWVKLREPLTVPEANRSSGILVSSPLGKRLYTMHDQVEVFAWDQEW